MLISTYPHTTTYPPDTLVLPLDTQESWHPVQFSCVRMGTVVPAKARMVVTPGIYVCRRDPAGTPILISGTREDLRVVDAELIARGINQY